MIEKCYLYKVKAFNALRGKTFKVLIAATYADEALKIAEELAGPGGWVMSIKDINKDVIIKGEEYDQSE